jgi:putative copper export protein
MRVHRTLLGAALGLAALADTAGAAFAHHSYSMFDRSRTTTIQGTVWTWEMINPHSFLWVVVTKPDGTTEKWGREGAGVGMLQKAGVSKSAVKTGDKVTVDLHPLRDGRTGGQLVRVVLADGKVLGGFGGGGQNGAPE